MKFEFFGILVWRNLSQPGGAIGDSNSPKRIARHGESNCYGRTGSVHQRRELALRPPFSDGGSPSGTAQTIDFTCGGNSLERIRGRELRLRLGYRTPHQYTTHYTFTVAPTQPTAL